MMSASGGGAARIGLIGTESSHAEVIVHHLNVERRFDPWRVVALRGPDPGRDAELAALGSVNGIAPEISLGAEDMVGRVDAVIVTDRDGGRHRAHAVPFLQAGIPVFVDKPLATSIEDAEAIIEAARVGNALVTSFSALRWAPLVQDLARSVGSGSVNPAAAFAVGPAKIDSEHGGIFYYAVHSVEAVCQVLEGEVGDVAVTVTDTHVIAHGSIGGVVVIVVLMQPSEGESEPFHLSIAGHHGVVGGDIVLAADYLAPGLEQFFGMIESGVPPLTAEEMLRPVVFLSAIRDAMERVADT